MSLSTKYVITNLNKNIIINLNNVLKFEFNILSIISVFKQEIH